MVGSADLNLDGLLNEITNESLKGSRDSEKVIKSRISAHRQDLREKRQKRIENLKEQFRGVSGSGCLSFFKPIAKIFDVLTLPLSVLSMGKLQASLSKTLEALDEAKKQGKLLNLKINQADFSKAVEQLKKMLSDDFEQLSGSNDQTRKEQENTLKLIEEIHRGFDGTTKL